MVRCEGMRSGMRGLNHRSQCEGNLVSELYDMKCPSVYALLLLVDE